MNFPSSQRLFPIYDSLSTIRQGQSFLPSGGSGEALALHHPNGSTMYLLLSVYFLSHLNIWTLFVYRFISKPTLTNFYHISHFPAFHNIYRIMFCFTLIIQLLKSLTISELSRKKLTMYVLIRSVSILQSLSLFS